MAPVLSSLPAMLWQRACTALWWLEAAGGQGEGSACAHLSLLPLHWMVGGGNIAVGVTLAAISLWD